MSITRYKNAKSIALTVAMMLATSAMVTGCSEVTPEQMTGVEVVSNSETAAAADLSTNFSQTGNLEDLTLEDLYIQENGNYTPYHSYAASNEVNADTQFYYVNPQDGNYVEWTPKLEDWNYLMALDDEDGSDVYVQDTSGSFVPYFMWWHFMSSSQRSSVAWNNTNFATQAADGSFSAYKPSTDELNQIKSGKFVGKTPNRPAVKSSNVQGNGTTSSLSKSTSGVTKAGTTTTGTTTTGKSTGTTGKATSVTTTKSTGGTTTTFGGSTTRSGGGSTTTGG